MAAGEDLAINLWDLGSGKRIKKMAGHTASVYSLAFSEESSMLVSGGADWTVRCWDVGAAGGPQSKAKENGVLTNGNGNAASTNGDAPSAKEEESIETCVFTCVAYRTVLTGCGGQLGPASDIPDEADADRQRAVHTAEPVSRRRPVPHSGAAMTVEHAYPYYCCTYHTLAEDTTAPALLYTRLTPTDYARSVLGLVQVRPL